MQKLLLFLLLFVAFGITSCNKVDPELERQKQQEEEEKRQKELEEQHQKQIIEDMNLVSINDLTVSYDGNNYSISIDGLKDNYEAKLDEDMKQSHSYPGVYNYHYQITEKGSTTVLKELEATLTIEIEVKEFHTEVQLQVINNPYSQATIYAKGEEELSIPNPIHFEFETDGILKLGQSKDNLEEYETVDKQVDVYNLYANTIYCYSFNDNEFNYFITSKTPRNLYVDGVTNVRDLGGWIIDENNVVKQGMILRTSKLNADESEDFVITEEGIKTLLAMGIKTEIDLRRSDNNENGNITASPLGETVNYISLPMKSGGDIILLNKEQIVNLFDILADENNYPLIFHCSIGTDRTGCVAFLINGLLGVSQDDLYYDYMFSNLGLIGRMRTTSAVDAYIKTVKYSDGETLAEKIYSYLVSIGVSKEKLDTVKNLLTEHIEK